MDPRTTPFRQDIAAAHLVGKVKATRFVQGTKHSIISSYTNLHKAPLDKSMCTTQLLFGEEFILYDSQGDWGWGQNLSDSYVGYVKLEDLGTALPTPSHAVRALRSYAYAEANFKSPVQHLLSMGSRVKVEDEASGYGGETYAKIVGSGWIPMRHLRQINDVEANYVDIARSFIGTPYLWGGRTSIGLDCSALVQIALDACGIRAPRDSDMQQDQLRGNMDITASDFSLQAGDIAFFPEHVGIMADETHIINANSYHSQTVIEPISDLIARGFPGINNYHLSAVKRPKTAAQQLSPKRNGPDSLNIK